MDLCVFDIYHYIFVGKCCGDWLVDIWLVCALHNNRIYASYGITSWLHTLVILSFFPFFSNRAGCSVQQNSSDLSITCALNEQQRIGTYGGLTVGLIFLNLLRGVLLYIICVNASRVLHNRLFASVLRAPVLFFDNNPSGKLQLYLSLLHTLFEPVFD